MPGCTIQAAAIPHALTAIFGVDIMSHLNMTGIERVTIASCIQLEREKTNNTPQDAQYFRNVAESLKTEKRELASKLNNKVELVRDFWNNTERGPVEHENWCKEHLTNELYNLYTIIIIRADSTRPITIDTDLILMSLVLLYCSATVYAK